MRDIGKNIKELRQLKKMTQDELAGKLFVTRQTVSNYETGKSRPDIEMLTRIAETLETDPNTVLYGIPQKVNQERAVLRLCVCVVLLIIAVVGYGHLADLAKGIAAYSYDQSLAFAGALFAAPILGFLFGLTAMQALGVFAKLTAFTKPWAKRMLWIVLGTVIGYLLITLPFVLGFILKMDISNLLPDFIYTGQFYSTLWLIGLWPNRALLKPNILIFGILGCALWLGIPQKPKE